MGIHISNQGSGGGGTPGGSDTYVQYNDAGAFGGDANLTWDKTTQKLAIGADGTLSGTAGLTVQDDTGGSSIVFGSGNVNIDSSGAGRVQILSLGGNPAGFNTSNLTTNRLFVFPDKAGTFALLSDLTSSVDYSTNFMFMGA